MDSCILCQTSTTVAPLDNLGILYGTVWWYAAISSAIPHVPLEQSFNQNLHLAYITQLSVKYDLDKELLGGCGNDEGLKLNEMMYVHCK